MGYLFGIAKSAGIQARHSHDGTNAPPPRLATSGVSTVFLAVPVSWFAWLESCSDKGINSQGEQPPRMIEENLGNWEPHHI